MRKDPDESEAVFQRGDLDDNVNVQEIPDFSDKGCMWLWAWCIGPVIKLALWMFQNYMALKTGYGYMKASNSQINITTGSSPEYGIDDLGIKLKRNDSDCGELNSYSPDDGLFFAKWTFCICLIPTVLLSSFFLMDFRKTLKQADKWTWCNTFLFIFGMITQSGYFIKHVAMIVYGVRARRLLRQTNNPFDEDVQREWYLHRHAQSHLEHMRRIEALIKLVPQTILQLYIIWYVIDHTGQDLDSQLRCLKPTWILTGVSILKFSLDASLNVKEFDLHAGIRYFKRHELDEAIEFYSDNSPAGKTPICLLYNMCAITSRCIFVSLMFYYMPSRYPHVLTIMFLAHLILMALPTALIGSYSKSIFEEIGRKVERKNRKLLWTCWYFIMALPWILIMWTSSLYSWVDVYGIPGTVSLLMNFNVTAITVL